MPRYALSSKKAEPTSEDCDARDLILDAALGKDKYDGLQRVFALEVLGVLGLIAYAENNCEVPTPTLRDMAAVRRQNERELREDEHQRRPEEKSKKVPKTKGGRGVERNTNL